MTKLIFVLIDGLDMASSAHMSFLAAHEAKGVFCNSLNCELPSLSRPIYSTIFTGKTPLETKITSNNKGFLPRELYENSFFSKMQKAKFTTAAAAYYWMRELYCMEEYNHKKHRLSVDNIKPISYGIFYNSDEYPDTYVFQDAEALRVNYKPDFLLVHSMGVDFAGHNFGADSAQYRNSVRNVDMLLAEYIPVWLEQNIAVIITSDHGMHKDGAHNDTLAEVRQVPYWILGATSGFGEKINSQTKWYNLLCDYYF